MNKVISLTFLPLPNTTTHTNPQTNTRQTNEESISSILLNKLTVNNLEYADDVALANVAKIEKEQKVAPMKKLGNKTRPKGAAPLAETELARRAGTGRKAIVEWRRTTPGGEWMGGAGITSGPEGA